MLPHSLKASHLVLCLSHIGGTVGAQIIASPSPLQDTGAATQMSLHPALHQASVCDCREQDRYAKHTTF